MFRPGILFLDARGRVVLSHPKKLYPAGTDLSRHFHVAQALRECQISISPPFRDPATGRHVAAVTVPIWSKEGNFLGLIGGMVDLQGPELMATLFPPTSLYHLFLEPEVAPGVKLLGSVLALFISVPTIGVFLLIVASLQACANGQGARGLFGWLGKLPWRNPAFSAIGMATVSAFGGGVVANVLIQERLARLLSDTLAVPGYFHCRHVLGHRCSLPADAGASHSWRIKE